MLFCRKRMLHQPSSRFPPGRPWQSSWDLWQEGSGSQPLPHQAAERTSEQSNGCCLTSLVFLFHLKSFSHTWPSPSDVETTEVLRGAPRDNDTAFPARTGNARSDSSPRSTSVALPPACRLSRAALLVLSIAADTHRKPFSALSSL